MGLEPAKQDTPTHKNNQRDDPEVGGQVEAVPEPDFIDQAVAVTIDQVKDRVELDDGLILERDLVDVPEYGRKPEADAHNDLGDLGQVPEKEHHRRGDPGYAQYQYKGGKQVIDEL